MKAMAELLLGLGAAGPVAALAVVICTAPVHAAASAAQKGQPRFASLKADRVNVRQGPSRDHAIKWVFKRAGLPVEILNSYENWRQVRDSEGTEGWVFQRLLSARRTALVIPWEKTPVIVELRGGPSQKEKVVAKLENGVLANIKACDGRWCKVSIGNYKGYLRQDQLWGVYKNEIVK